MSVFDKYLLPLCSEIGFDEQTRHKTYCVGRGKIALRLFRGHC
jgi:hypothetical protein